jgi:tetratricopeptide (TPR) repeat protein
VSDFGFDAYALDDAEPIGHPHPLEIARDLIATGKPQAALDALSLHHDRLANDPEYLLLCSEAWLAAGDASRAQQALLGAARLAPDDPRPLQWLAELLAGRGEHDRADLVLAKARALEDVAVDAEDPIEAMGLGPEDDLIAFAERQEHKAQAAFTPRQVLFVTGALGAVALLIAGIATLTKTEGDATLAVHAGAEPEVSPAPREEVADAPTTIEAPQPESLSAKPPELEVAPSPPIVVTPEVMQPEPQTATPNAPEPEPLHKEASPSRGSGRAPSTQPTAKAKPKPKAATADQPAAPSAAVVQAEFGSMDPAQLTARGDALYAQGHTSLGASYYRRALELDPDFAPALVGMGRSILRAKKYSDAMANAARALQLARGVDARPGLEAVAIYQMARVHFERGELDAARRLFRQSISLPGTPDEAWFYLGEALSSDNSRAAREAYEQYLELVPEGHLAERARRAIQ